MRFFKLLITVSILLPLFAYGKESDVYIGLSSKYNPDSLPKIGLAGFLPSDVQDVQLKENAFSVGDVVRADLMRSRYFDIQDNIKKRTVIYRPFFISI